MTLQPSLSTSGETLTMTKTHSRPYTSSDNPYSESNFKTEKYRPGFPARFESIEHARAHCRAFVDWYNHAHRHSGIGLMTPAAVHHGTPSSCTPPAPPGSMPPSPATPSDSSASRPSRPSCRTPPGSTSLPTGRKPPLTKFEHEASHRA
jgi:putative transposase